MVSKSDVVSCKRGDEDVSDHLPLSPMFDQETGLEDQERSIVSMTTWPSNSSTF